MIYVFFGLLGLMWALLPDVNHMTRDGHIPRWTPRTVFLRLFRFGKVMGLVVA